MDIIEFKNIACQRIKTKRQTSEIPSSTKYSRIQKKRYKYEDIHYNITYECQKTGNNVCVQSQGNKLNYHTNFMEYYAATTNDNYEKYKTRQYIQDMISETSKQQSVYM